MGFSFVDFFVGALACLDSVVSFWTFTFCCLCTFRKFLNASKVAYTFDAWLFVPSTFDNISFIPAASTTALTAPPAITPVPYPNQHPLYYFYPLLLPKQKIRFYFRQLSFLRLG